MEWINPYTWPIFGWVSLFFSPRQWSYRTLLLGGPKLSLWRCLWRRTGVKKSGRNGWKGSDWQKKLGDIWDTVGTLERNHFRSFWILSFCCFLKCFPQEIWSFEIEDVWYLLIFETFRLKIFPNTVAMFQESPCTCSLSLLGPPKHVYLFERSICSWRVGLFWVGVSWILHLFLYKRNPGTQCLSRISFSQFHVTMWQLFQLYLDQQKKLLKKGVKQSRTGSTYSSLWLH